MRTTLEEKVKMLVDALRRHGRDMRLSQEELDQEIIRTLGIWQSNYLSSIRKALDSLGVVIRVGHHYVWGKGAERYLSGPKRTVVLSLDARLVEELERRGVDIGQAVEGCLRRLVSQRSLEAQTSYAGQEGGENRPAVASQKENGDQSLSASQAGSANQYMGASYEGT